MALIVGLVLTVAFVIANVNPFGNVTAIDNLSPGTIYVDDDADPGWYDATHVKTIQEGIDNASSGDTVFVYNGTYYENVVVNKSIDLIGENKESTIVTRIQIEDTDYVNVSRFTLGPYYVLHNFVKVLNSPNTSVTDCIIDGSGNPGPETHGIGIYSEYVYVANNTIKNLDYQGIFGNFSHCTIYNNTIQSMGANGMHIEGLCEYNTIYCNTISNTGLWAIRLRIPQVKNNYIYHNNFIGETCYDQGGPNYWDNGYPSGGNYWSIYSGTDNYHGPNQDIPGSDGIGDTPYSFSGGQDNYPYMQQNGWQISPPSDNVYVDDGYDSSTPGWGYDHFDNIQDGIDAVAENGTVYVFNGTYYENVVIINKTVNLIGENKDTTIIDAKGNGTPSRNSVLLIAKWGPIYTNISGFTVRNASSGIYIENGTEHIKIEDCIIKDCGKLNWDAGIGIYSHVNRYVSIINCTIHNNTGYGIYSWRGFGFHLPYFDRITGCTLYNNSNGILLYAHYYTNITDCKVYGNDGFGIGLSGQSDPMGGWGSDCANNLIKNCCLYGNYYGIYLTGENVMGEQSYALNNTIRGCNISNNFYGLHQDNLANDNSIYHNNFINNTIQAYDMGNNTWDNGYPSGGNYWSDFDEPSEGAYDNNSDGIVDSPYNISGGSNQDLYPLMYPFGAKTAVSVIPSSKVVNANESFTINITINPTEPIAGAQADLLFDPSLITVNSVTDGGMFGMWFNANLEIDNVNGAVRNISAIDFGSVTTPGVFAIIEFTAGSIDGISPLNLTNVIVGDPYGTAVSIMVNNGNVTVIPYPDWDVNMDDSVNILDLIIVGQHWGETGDPGWIRADVNKDGVINILDLILIGQHWTG